MDSLKGQRRQSWGVPKYLRRDYNVMAFPAIYFASIFLQAELYPKTAKDISNVFMHHSSKNPQLLCWIWRLIFYQENCQIYNQNHPFYMDTSLRKQRLRALTAILAGISGLLSIGHFIVLGLSVSLAKEFDAEEQRFIDYPPDLYINLNMPFAISLAVLGAIQLAASLLTLFFNMKRIKLDKISLISLGGAAASFAVSFLVTTAAITQNRLIGGLSRDSTLLPTFAPFCHWLQVDALLNGLLSLPFLLFIFYRHLEGYLQNQQTVTQTGRKQFWIFTLLINACAHFALVIRTYQFSYNENPQTYTLEFFFSTYTYSLVVELAVCLIAFIVLVLHFELFSFIRTPLFKSCLTRSQVIIVTVAAAIFQLAALVLILVKTLQIYIDRASAAQRGSFLFRDNDEEKSFQIFLTFILIISACSLGALLISLKKLPTIQSEEDKQKSLLSEGHQQT